MSFQAITCTGIYKLIGLLWITGHV